LVWAFAQAATNRVTYFIMELARPFGRSRPLIPSGGRNPIKGRPVCCMDEDLNDLSREQLIDEVKRLRAGIRQHRDNSGHDLCWHHPELWGSTAGARYT
jgi:hypothetical protein